MMKKLIAMIMATLICLSAVACGGTPASGASSGSVATPSSDVAPEPEPAPEPEVVAIDPATFAPAFDSSPKPGMKQGFDSVFYDGEAEISLNYIAAENEIYMLINGGGSRWPTELNQEWTDWGYTAISTENGVNIRTLAPGQYGKKQAKVIKDTVDQLFDIPGLENSTVKGTVPYSVMTLTEYANETIIATVALECLYLQAWRLVPAELQGVIVIANGETYTTDMIMKFPPEAFGG